MNIVRTCPSGLIELYYVYGIKSAYGKTIENQVIEFYNLFDINDSTLKLLYFAELDYALRLTGAEKGRNWIGNLI
jgi:hypothetical protein